MFCITVIFTHILASLVNVNPSCDHLDVVCHLFIAPSTEYFTKFTLNTKQLF